jgi:hypothetical protein
MGRKKTFTLKNGSMAVSSESNQSSVVHIPANTQVILVEGDIERDRFVTIRYAGNTLLMLSEDLRRGIGLVSDQSRS